MTKLGGQVNEFDDACDTDNINELIFKERSESKKACNFEDFIGFREINSVEDFAQSVYELVDTYIDLGVALSFVAELNRYVYSHREIKDDVLKKYGKTSKIYSDADYVDSYISSVCPGIATIWDAKSASLDLYGKIVKIACKLSKDLLKNPAMVRIALLRFYVSGLLNRMLEADGLESNAKLDCVRDAYSISAAIKEMDFCWSLNEARVLSKYHSVGARSNKLNRDNEKHQYIARLADNAWRFGCDLLHTQLLNLLIIAGVANESDRVSIKRKLKSIAPKEKIFGPGAIKTTDACPCNNSPGCPLLAAIEIKKRYSLPV